MELFQRLHFLCIRRGEKKEQEETSELEGEGKKFSVYIKKIMLRVNER